MNSTPKRVVVTGMGTINPLGDSLEEYYSNLMAGKSGIKVWETLDVSNIECKIGGDIGNYDTKAALKGLQDDLGEDFYKKAAKLFKTATFSSKTAVLSSLYAWKDAGLMRKDLDPFRTGVIVGGHNLNSKYLFENQKQFLEEPEFIQPLSGVEGIDPNVPGLISEVLSVHGPTFTIGGACASGNLALREGYRDIILGEVDRAVITGAVFDMSQADIHASAFIGAVVTKPEYQTAPEEASRPFDAGRCGFVYSHGTACMVLEELEAAKARGARIYAEVVGVKASSNACHLPQPSAEFQGILISALLKEINLSPEEIDYVNCHATATPSGDIEEIKAIKKAFGDHAYKLKLNAPKSMLGHTCWAAPLVEGIGGIMQMNRGRLHGSINIDNLDPAVDLDVCSNGPVDHPVRYMLKNSFGFGGINCCAIYKKWEE